MATFKVNTGTREQEVCSLEWDWELKVDPLGATVFVIPGHLVKNREDRLVVLNTEARGVLDRVRGRHSKYVFAYRGTRLFTMNNTAWQSARSRAATKFKEKTGREAPWGLANVRVHDLKHTFGRRLRAAGVPEETRAVLLGHKTRSMPTHYSVAELAELIAAVNRIDRTLATPAITLLRAAA